MNQQYQHIVAVMIIIIVHNLDLCAAGPHCPIVSETISQRQVVNFHHLNRTSKYSDQKAFVLGVVIAEN